MTREETKEILAVIQAAYPSFHRERPGHEKSDAEWKAVINIWAIAMSDFPYGFITNGFKRLVQNNKFPPSPAEVIEAAKASAMDWCDVTGRLQWGGTIAPDAWLFVDHHPIQFAEWNKERLRIKAAIEKERSLEAGGQHERLEQNTGNG